MKARFDADLQRSGITFLEVLRYSGDHQNELPGFDEETTEAESRERFLRIAASILLHEPDPYDTTKYQKREVAGFYEQTLLGPLRAYFVELESSTEELPHNRALALVKYAGYRGFKDEARTALNVADRQVLVALHLLLTRIMGYERPDDDDLDSEFVEGQEPS